MIGAAQFLLGLVHLVRWNLLSTISTHRTSNVIAVAVYYLCVVVCFLLSTIFHTFSDHSANMHRFGNELDHLGIVLVMWGTGVSGAHFVFSCEPHLQTLYHVALTGTAFGCSLFTLRRKFRQPGYRTMRFLMYCGLGASLFAPVVHGGLRFGLTRTSKRIDLPSFLGLALINLSGAALYAARIPERWFPRRFDLIGQSHNLMHVLVLIGALVRLDGLFKLMTLWEKPGFAKMACSNAA